MFHDIDRLVMLIAVAPVEKGEPIRAGIQPIVAPHTGMMFASDVSVSRGDIFHLMTHKKSRRSSSLPICSGSSADKWVDHGDTGNVGGRRR